MIYIILFLYEAIICYIYDYRKLNEKRSFEIKNYKLRMSTVKGLYSMAIITPLWFVMGFRYNIGADYKNYEKIFLYAVHDKKRYLVELGYYYLNRIAGLFSENPQIIFLLTAFLIILFMLKGIERNNGSMYYGILGCMGLGYYFYAMNIQRQYVAIMIMLYAFYFLEEKRLREYMICVVIAASFHVSAIVWIPVYFAINYIPTKVFYVGTFIIAILVNRFGALVLNKLANWGFYTWQIWGNKSFFREHFQWPKVVMLGGFLFCRFFFRTQQKDKEKIDLKYKSIWLAFLIYTFFYIYGEAASRIAMYMSVICVLVLTDIVSCLEKRTRKWARLLITVILVLSMIIMITREGNEGQAFLPYKYRFL